MNAGSAFMLSFMGQQDKAEQITDVLMYVMNFIEPFQKYISPFGVVGVVMEVLQYNSHGLSEIFDIVKDGFSGGIQEVWNLISSDKSPLHHYLSEDFDIPVTLPSTRAIENFYNQLNFNNPILDAIIHILPNSPGQNTLGNILLLSTGTLFLGMAASGIDISAGSAPILQGLSWVFTILGAIMEYSGHWSSLIYSYFSALTGYFSEVLFMQMGLTEPISLLLLAISPTIGLGITAYNLIS